MTDAAREAIVILGVAPVTGLIVGAVISFLSSMLSGRG